MPVESDATELIGCLLESLIFGTPFLSCAVFMRMMLYTYMSICRNCTNGHFPPHRKVTRAKCNYREKPKIAAQASTISINKCGNSGKLIAGPSPVIV